MSHRFSAPIFICVLFLLTSCGGGGAGTDSVMLSDDANLPGIVGDIPEPEFRGELPIGRSLVADISEVIGTENYEYTHLDKVSRDGSNILVAASTYEMPDGNGGTSVESGFIRIDTDTGTAESVVSGIHPYTLIYFDENNNAVGATSLGCTMAPTFYAPNEVIIDFNSLMPEGFCIGRTILSDDGSVAMFFAQDLRPLENGEFPINKFFTYHFDSALLVELPDFTISVDGVLLEPDYEPIRFFGGGPSLSNDGAYALTGQWWGLYQQDERDELIRAGSVLWNTRTNQWQTRGLIVGNLDWCNTGFDECISPFARILSANGEVLYSQIPNGDRLLSDQYGFVYESAMVRSLSGSMVETPIPGLENLHLGFDVNRDGSLLAFYATERSGQLADGLSLYSHTSADFVSIDSAFSSCSQASDEAGGLSCDDQTFNEQFNTFFTADGANLLLASFSSASTRDQYILDIEDGGLYRLPSEIGGGIFGAVSGDASVFVAEVEDSESSFSILHR